MQRIYVLLLIVLITTIKASAGNPGLQLLNISADPFLGFAKVELNDSILIDTFRFNEGTAFLEVPEGSNQTLRFTALLSSNSIFELTDLNFEADRVYQSILYGVQDDTEYTPNPDGQSLLTNATFVEVDTSGVDTTNMRVNFFHAVGDAVEVDIADLVFEFIVDDMAFGEYSSNTTDLPADLRSIFFTSTDSVVTIASRSIDLGNISGNTLTIFLSGFIISVDNESGPILGFHAIDQAGNVIELGLVLATPLDEVLSDLKIYPNPTSHEVILDFYNTEVNELELLLTDLNGKLYLNESLPVNSGSNHIRIELPDVPNGLYHISLSNRNQRVALPLVILK